MKQALYGAKQSKASMGEVFSIGAMCTAGKFGMS